MLGYIGKRLKKLLQTYRPEALWMLWVLIVAGALGTVVRAEEGGAQGPLNVILISLDTVRPDHLSCYGYHRKTTPNIDCIAKEGVRFANAFSQTSSTHSSHLSIFTSRYPTRQWVHWEGNDMDVSVETLTESLRRAGYFTAAFTGLSEVNENHRSLLASRPFQAFDQMIQGVSLRTLPGKLWSELVRHRHQPFFFFVHGFDAHGPHVLPLKYDATRFNPHYHGPLASTHFELWESASSSLDELAQLLPFQRYSFECTRHLEQLGASDHVDAADLYHLLALYDAQLYYLDQGLGELFQALKALKLMDRTVLVILSDHGEAFGEHGLYAAHGRCYDEDTRMVLIVRDPHLPKARRGRAVRQLVQGIDVMPTILELLHLPIPVSVQGTSLASLLRTGRDAMREEVAVSASMGMCALRTPQWKLINAAGVPAELYHVTRDPQEQRNLITKFPTIAAQLQWRLDQTITAEAAGPAVDLRQWLQDKGYW